MIFTFNVFHIFHPSSSLTYVLIYWICISLNCVHGMLMVTVQNDTQKQYNKTHIGNSCKINDDSYGSYSLNVNGNSNCNVTIVLVDDVASDKLIVLDIIEANIKGADHMYIEDSKSNLKTRYVAFFGAFKSHRIVFHETNLRLYVRTTSVINVSTEIRNRFDNTNTFNWNDTDGMQISVYENVLTCPLKTFGVNIATIAECYNPCAGKCKCNLQPYSIVVKCPNDHKPAKTLLILPSNFNSLDLANNSLSSIKTNSFNSFQNEEDIRWLYLDNNSLKVLERGMFSGLSKLGYLDLSYTQLTDIQAGAFVGLTDLDELYLDYNNLTSLKSTAFMGLRNLQTLHLCCNHITHLPPRLFKDLTNLVWLSVAANDLVLLDHRTFIGSSPNGFMCLAELTLQKNSIKKIPDELPSLLPNLTTMNLAFNHLNDLPKLKKMINLKILDIRSNPLKRVKKETFSGLRSGSALLVDEPGTCCFTESVVQCNATNAEPPYLTCERLLPNITLRMFMWILGWSALLGNLFVLVWRCIGKMEEDTVQSHLITNLAVSDMLTGIYMLILVFADIHFEKYFPSYAEEWRIGSICKLAGVIALTACEASVFFVTLISLDRFIRVVYPYTIHRLNPQSTQTAALLLWAISLTLGGVAIAFVGVNNDVYDISEVCIGLPLVKKSVYKIEVIKYKPPEWYINEPSVTVTTQVGSEMGMYFSIAIFLGLNLICFMVVMFCYIAIFKAVRDTSKRVKLTRHRDREIRMAARMFLIVATDFLCWVPIIITGILVQSNVVEISPAMFAWAVTFIMPINSSVNPYLYTLTTMLTKRLGCRQSACTGSTGLSEKSERPSRNDCRENTNDHLAVTGNTKQNGLTFQLASKV